MTIEKPSKELEDTSQEKISNEFDVDKETGTKEDKKRLKEVIKMLHSREEPNQEYYDRLIEEVRQDKSAMPTLSAGFAYPLYIRPFFKPMDEQEEKRSKETKEFLPAIVEDEICLDLAGGTKKTMAESFLAPLDVNCIYYNIDMRLDLDGISISKVDKVDVILEKGDILSSLLKIPDNSIKFISINGIDDITIILNTEYHKRLADHILRVLKPGGLIFGSCSASLEYLAAILRDENIAEEKKKNLQIVEEKGVFFTKEDSWPTYCFISKETEK